jgi:hypothetical protein
MDDRFEIRGGADEHIAAAIAAVLDAIVQEEREASATRPRPIRQSQWVQAGRPLERHAPIASADYNRLPGSDDGDEVPAPF